MRRSSCVALMLMTAAALSACGDTTPGPITSAQTTASTTAPADPKLASVYAQTCKSCHAAGIGGAPVSGDKKAWDPRVAQGMATLLDHTINGYKGMPPLGACMDCGETEFEALIRFMAGIEGT